MAWAVTRLFQLCTCHTCQCRHFLSRYGAYVSACPEQAGYFPDRKGQKSSNFIVPICKCCGKVKINAAPGPLKLLHDCFLRRMCSFYHHLFMAAVVLSTTSSSATFATRGMSSPSSCELLRTPGVRGSLPDTAQYGCAWLTSGDKSITLLFVCFFWTNIFFCQLQLFTQCYLFSCFDGKNTTLLNWVSQLLCCSPHSLASELWLTYRYGI